MKKPSEFPMAFGKYKGIKKILSKSKLDLDIVRDIEYNRYSKNFWR